MLQQPCKTGQSDEGLKPLLRAEGGGRIKMAECKTPQLETVSKECTRKWQRRQADIRSGALLSEYMAKLKCISDVALQR